MKTIAQNLKSVMILFSLITITYAFSIHKPDSNDRDYRQFSDVQVGSQLMDSLGQVTISNILIQKDIMSSVQSLQDLKISDEPTKLIIHPDISYLFFTALSSSGGKMSVAIQVSPVNSIYFFQPNNNPEIHICSYNGCSNCSFSKSGNRIIYCK